MMTPPTEMLFGTCRQLLFSRDGAIEGCLITVKGKTAQVSMTSEEGSLLSQMIGPGKRMRILATPDLSADAIDAPHPVFCFVALADSQGEPLDMPDIEPGASAISGQVSMLTYAQHGQPNGVVLDTGEFIHVGTDAMRTTALRAGSKVRAVGELRRTLLGSRMLDERLVNGVQTA